MNNYISYEFIENEITFDDQIDTFAYESNSSQTNRINIIINAVIKIIDSVINFCKKIVDFIKKRLDEFSNFIKSLMDRQQVYMSAKKKTTAAQLFSINNEIRQLNKKLNSISPDSEEYIKLKEAYDALLIKRDKIKSSLPDIDKYYMISLSHKSLYDEGERISGLQLKKISNIYSAYSTDIEKYDFIPLMHNKTMAELDMTKADVILGEVGQIQGAGGRIGASMSVGASTILGKYSKEYGESDPEYNEYIEIIDSYDDGAWKYEAEAAKNQINSILEKIRDLKETEISVEKVELIRIDKHDAMLTALNEFKQVGNRIQKSINKYQTILDTKYKKPGKAFTVKRSGIVPTFLTKKAPQYLLKVVQLYMTMYNYHDLFRTSRANLLFTISNT